MMVIPKTTRKPLTAFEEFAAKLIADNENFPTIKGVNDVRELLMDDVCEGYIGMTMSDNIADFQKFADSWFTAHVLLFSERHFL